MHNLHRIALHRIAAALAVTMLMGPAAALAQDDPQPPPGPRDRLVIERIQNGFLVAPDVRITEVDGEFATLAGLYGGWLMDDTLLIGAGGYWLANGHDDVEMAYGGLVVEWLARTERRIGFAARGLVGGGSATVSSPLADLAGGGRFGRAAFPAEVRFGRGPRPLSDLRVVFRERFLVVEPQAGMLVNLTESIRFNAGVGYRLIGDAGRVGDRVEGFTGSVTVQFGFGN